MNEKISAVAHDYEAECERLREIINCMKAQHKEEKDSYKLKIAELEQALMIYEQKWSVVQLIFGK